jgi:hypothetical protein
MTGHFQYFRQLCVDPRKPPFNGIGASVLGITGKSLRDVWGPACMRRLIANLEGRANAPRESPPVTFSSGGPFPPCRVSLEIVRTTGQDLSHCRWYQNVAWRRDLLVKAEEMLGFPNRLLALFACPEHQGRALDQAPLWQPIRGRTQATGLPACWLAG